MSELNRGSEYGILRFAVDVGKSSASTSVVEYLIKNGVSNAPDLVDLGSVYVNEERVTHQKFTIQNEDRIRVHSQPRRYSKPNNLASRILESHKDYFVIDKPPGLPVHSQVDNAKENLLKFLEEELREPLFITHRLDVETSGCLIVARNSRARSEINERFRERLVDKNYVAYVTSPVSPAKYTHFMKPSFKAPREVVAEQRENWLKCDLVVRACDQTDISRIPDELKFEIDTSTKVDMYRLEIELLTGRPQQIRAQLAALNAPIVGDRKYGSEILLRPEANAIALRCSAIKFKRPLAIGNPSPPVEDEIGD